MPAWLAEQVGSSVRVVASDIDTAWMPAHGAAFEVLRHDVGVEQPPAGSFDLVHARLLLTHVPRRIEAITSMVRALCPGGGLSSRTPTPRCSPDLPGRNPGRRSSSPTGCGRGSAP